MTQYYFFWKSYDPCSNWFKCNFTYKGIEFNCSEQAMMWEKAMMFGDKKTASDILMETEPSKQKALGRTIKNYDDKLWNVARYEIVKEILRHKFRQNPKLEMVLLKHSGNTFVEASPFDRIWGIGYYEDNALENINNWGQNLLGKILTELAVEFENQ